MEENQVDWETAREAKSLLLMYEILVGTAREAAQDVFGVAQRDFQFSGTGGSSQEEIELVERQKEADGRMSQNEAQAVAA